MTVDHEGAEAIAADGLLDRHRPWEGDVNADPVALLDGRSAREEGVGRSAGTFLDPRPPGS